MWKIFKTRKGYTVSDLLPLAVAFVVVAIAISMGAEVLGEIRDGQTANTYERNATTDGLESLAELSSWLPTIALIVAAAVIIGIIVVYLARRFA